MHVFTVRFEHKLYVRMAMTNISSISNAAQ